MITLKPNQIQEYDLFKKQKYLYLKAGTGWGKSFLAMKAIEDNPQASIIIAPAHLMPQWSEYLSKDLNIPHKVNSFGKFSKVSVWSVQKLTRMFKNDKFFLKEFKKQCKTGLLIMDEFHRMLGFTSNIYRSLQSIKASSYLFLSATPVEKGIADFYTALRINAVLDLPNNPEWGTSWRSVTNFKKYHCIMGGFEGRIIEAVTPTAKMKMLAEITVGHHEGIEDSLPVYKTIEVDADKADKIIKDYKKNEEYHFATARTMLNGFRYTENENFEKVTNWLFESQKVEELQFLVNGQNGKALIFYEFTAEVELLKKVKGIKFFHKTKYNKEKFEADKSSHTMAVHYRSLGEGVRFNFVDTIYLFTVSVSNRMTVQAIGRAIYSGRTKKIEVFKFTTNTKFEKSILKKLNDKAQKVKELFQEL